jgi:hypothetical protein
MRGVLSSATGAGPGLFMATQQPQHHQQQHQHHQQQQQQLFGGGYPGARAQEDPINLDLLRPFLEAEQPPDSLLADLMPVSQDQVLLNMLLESLDC